MNIKFKNSDEDTKLLKAIIDRNPQWVDKETMTVDTLKPVKDLIEQEREVVRVTWEDSKDELYTYFGKCECGETCIIVGSKYCHSCGNIISNPLRSND
jgi:hypothetical protein